MLVDILYFAGLFFAISIVFTTVSSLIVWPSLKYLFKIKETCAVCKKAINSSEATLYLRLERVSASSETDTSPTTGYICPSCFNSKNHTIHTSSADNMQRLLFVVTFLFQEQILQIQVYLDLSIQNVIRDSWFPQKCNKRHEVQQDITKLL